MNGIHAMHAVNLDLLRTLPHHADGRPKDPHAHHRATLAKERRMARRDHLRQALAHLAAALRPMAMPLSEPVVFGSDPGRSGWQGTSGTLG